MLGELADTVEQFLPRVSNPLRVLGDLLCCQEYATVRNKAMSVVGDHTLFDTSIKLGSVRVPGRRRSDLSTIMGNLGRTAWLGNR